MNTPVSEKSFGQNCQSPSSSSLNYYYYNNANSTNGPTKSQSPLQPNTNSNITSGIFISTLNNHNLQNPPLIRSGKTRINSSSTNSTSHSSTVYFPSTNQYFNFNNNRTPNASVASQRPLDKEISSLTLYAYLLQANKSLAKEVRASMIRSHTKSLEKDLDNDSLQEQESNQSESSIAFPGIQQQNSNNHHYNQYHLPHYRSSNTLKKRVLAANSRNSSSSLAYENTLASSSLIQTNHKRNIKYINSKLSN